MKYGYGYGLRLVMMHDLNCDSSERRRWRWETVGTGGNRVLLRSDAFGCSFFLLCSVREPCVTIFLRLCKLDTPMGPSTFDRQNGERKKKKTSFYIVDPTRSVGLIKLKSQRSRVPFRVKGHISPSQQAIKTERVTGPNCPLMYDNPDSGLWKGI